MSVKKKCLEARQNYCTSSIAKEANSPKFQITSLLSSKYDQHFQQQYLIMKHLTKYLSIHYFTNKLFYTQWYGTIAVKLYTIFFFICTYNQMISSTIWNK